MKKGEVRLELWEDDTVSIEKRWVFLKEPKEAKRVYLELREYLDELSKGKLVIGT